MERWDLVVVGGGPGGYNAAFRAADLGKKVAIIEKYNSLGGVCLNVGCIPSKSLLHVSEGLHAVKELKEMGFEVEVKNIDKSLDKVRAYRDSVMNKLTNGLSMLAKQRKVTHIEGVATFKDDHTFSVRPHKGAGEEFDVAFDNCILAIGSRPVQIPSFPNDDPRLIDSTGALKVEDVPKKLLIVGGGIIGLEMAEVYQALGSEITIVELMDHIIPPADKDLTDPLMKRFESFSTIYLKTKVTHIVAKPKGLEVSFEGAACNETRLFDKVLVAVGRRPNGDLLNAGTVGVQVDDKGFIAVDAQQRTNVPHIFAIGDVVGQPMLAHKAAHEGHVAAETVAGLKSAFAPMGIPSVAYTTPEIAWAGVTEKEAREKGLKYTKGVFPWAASGRAISMQAGDGKVKLLFDEETHRIIGGGIVGLHAGDLISEIMLAIELGADMVDLGKTIHPHPTLGETLGFAAEVAHGSITEIYVPKKK
ncbi:dihydrolipoyl dehydrogenase [Candidatus Haliotispira prima]|uniref:Dihydrolipoyl dehydrogenase n=1 Tax=Candidatus Haliotispira prima TaxID=3034016 RepID=A0ABY8MJK5_9SPIO|nr:dihydrolipoyl dehydrogenase [Candidatus Haliotispira prima]